MQLFETVVHNDKANILNTISTNKCNPPQEFDAKGESTLTTRLACRRSRICANLIEKTKTDTLAYVLVNLTR